MYATNRKPVASLSKASGSAPVVHINDTCKYPHRLSFYETPPQEDITLDEFEQSAIDRLHILSEIESCIARGRTNDEMKDTLKRQCLKYLPLQRGRSAETDAERRKDHIGHFVLRLAFGRSEDLRRRYVKVESILFKHRYNEDLIEDRADFLASRDFGWSMVDINDMEEGDPLKAELASFTGSGVGTRRWYKVRWTQIPNLVERRRVILRAGWAYVPEREQSSIIFQEFERRLEKALQVTSKAIPQLDEDTRLLPILEHLGQGFLNGMSIASEYSSSTEIGEGVTHDMIDDMASKHWPLCMRNLHDNLRRDRHLKYFARQQYQLFLKVVGLSIEEAIIFWRKAFMGGSIKADRFDKEYKYNIRHNYGLEGKRVNYPAFSCQRILTQNQPGTQDCHGCPYRHFSPDRLQTTLLSTYGSQGLKSGDVQEVIELVKGRHYHVACTRVYEATHGLQNGQALDGENVSHPNEYVAKSIELEKGREEGHVKAEAKADDGMDVS